MRILHTSDWHLGKNLEGASRIPEQIEFIDELVDICDDKEIDLILIAGDVFDTKNPPSKAEKLFYGSMRRLSKDGERTIIAIAGNHDNYERLTSSNPLASELGIILIGTPMDIVPKGFYGKNCQVVDSGEGFINFFLKGEEVVILTMPYPNELTLNKSLVNNNETDENKIQRIYSDEIKEIFKNNEKYYRKETINLAIGHFYLIGGEESSSERQIQLGGAYAVNHNALPKKAQYVAMGHLHRNQKISKKNIYYSGSPIEYSKSEKGNKKFVYVVELSSQSDPIIDKVELKNYKPIEIWKVSSIQEAITMCEENSQKKCWVYLEIETDKALTSIERKEMKNLKNDIIEIFPIIQSQNNLLQIKEELDKTPEQSFKEFYFYFNNNPPKEELVNLFLEAWNDNEIDKEDIS